MKLYNNLLSQAVCGKTQQRASGEAENTNWAGRETELSSAVVKMRERLGV